MYLTGGTLTVGEYWRMGKDADAGPGHVYMSGGNVTVNCSEDPENEEEGLVICRASSVECIFDMSGGFIDVKGYLAITWEYDEPVGTGTGTLNLSGGTIQAKNFTMGPGTAKFDIAGGTLILEGNITELPGVTGYGREGALDFDYDGGTNKTTITASKSPFATHPSPGDREQDVHPDADLSWAAGCWAADPNAHDVYFGTDWNDVNDANKLSPEYKGSPDLENTSFVLDRLEFGWTYYWRIDEVNDACQPGQPWKGTVWRFTVDDGKAHTPSPGDGVMSISTDTTLSWTAGILAASDNLYFGTDWNDVNDGTGGTDKGSRSPGYAPGGLEIGTIYYWRVDAVGDPTVKGNVWRFTTVGAVLMYYQFDGVEDANLPDPITDSTGNVTFNHLEKEHDGSLTYGPSNPFMNMSGTSARFTPEDGLWRFDTGSGDVLDLDIPAYTIEMFIRPNNLTTDDGTLIRRAEDSYALVIEEDDGVVMLEFEQSGASPVSFPADSMQEGKWYHIAAVFDSTDVNAPQKLYLDGEMVVSGGTTALNPDSGGPCAIGERREPDGSNGDFYDGLIDELRISDMALEPKHFLLPIDPGQAWNPSPKNLAEDVPPNVVLSWTPGDYAADPNAHYVYLGTDYNDVNDANNSWPVGTSVYKGPLALDANEYAPGFLEFGQMYYWRIDEVNDACRPEPWKGRVWRFTVADYITIDDMEDYTENYNEYPISYWSGSWGWDCGFTPPYTGSTLSLGLPEYGAPVRDKQSMVYVYNNMDDAFYSEISNHFPMDPCDWTYADVKMLTLWFYGDTGNDADETEQMYVGLEDNDGNYAEVRYPMEDMDDIKIAEWQEWNIALSDFKDDNPNLNLTDVNTLHIGFGDRNGSVHGGGGFVYFDDIRLYPPVCVPSERPEAFAKIDFNNDCIVDFGDVKIMAEDWLMSDVNLGEVSEPCDANLVGWWMLDEGSGSMAYDSSDYHNDGTLQILDVNVSWVAGRNDVNCALEFSGGRVRVPNAQSLMPMHQVSACAWIYYSDEQDSARIVVKGADDKETYDLEVSENDELVFLVRDGNDYDAEEDDYEKYAAESGEDALGRDEWIHITGTYDGNTVKCYINGELAAENNDPNISAIPFLSQDTNDLAIGNQPDDTDNGLGGTIDDVRVYNYGLSAAEVAYLATDGGQNGVGIFRMQSVANLYTGEPPGSGVINLRDFAKLSDVWLEEKLWPE